MKKLISLAAAVGIMLTVCGCSNKNSSSGTEAPTITNTDYVTGKDAVAYETKSALFNYSVDKKFSPEKQDDKNSGIDNIFKITKSGMLEVMEQIGYHHRAKGFTEGTMEGYKSDSSFSNVQCREIKIGSLSAWELTADAAENMRYSQTIAQYGNGDLFCILLTAPEDEYEECVKQRDSIFESVSYKGAPLKTAQETYEDSFCKVDVPVNWAVKKAKNGFTAVLNLMDEAEEAFISFSANVLDDYTKASVAAEDDYKDKKERYKDSECTCTDIDHNGIPAKEVRYTTSLGGGKIGRKSIYYETNGKVVCVTLCWHKDKEALLENVDVLFNSITFK